MDWMLILAGLINGTGVMIVVQFLKHYGMDWLKLNAPWSLPIIAMFAAQIFGVLTSVVSDAIGYPIDFSPIAAVLVGTGTIAAYDVAHAIRKPL